MERVGVHARRRSQPGGPMERPHSNRRKSDPTRFRGPPTGPRDEQCVWLPPDVRSNGGEARRER
eukprot:538310-Prymnesium_polylepis.1